MTTGLAAALGVLLLVALPAGTQPPGGQGLGGPGRGPLAPGPGPAGSAAARAGFAGPGPAGTPATAVEPAAAPPATDGRHPGQGGPPVATRPGGPLPTAIPPDPAGDAPPQRVRIPAIGVDAPLEALHLLPDGTLRAPTAWADAGWYADGTRPGDIGPAVIAGHIDSRSGPAVFYRLDRLRAGSLVEVERAGRWLAFRTVSVARYPKNAFPTAQVYGPTPDSQLRLITCGGAFDRGRGSYRDNTVVYAVAA